MALIIDFESIKDKGKREWLLRTLQYMGIKFRTTEDIPQTVEEYNQDLEQANARIEAGNYTTMDDLLKEIQEWK